MDLHDDLWIWHGFFDLLVRQDATSVDVEFVLYDNVFSENCHILHTRLKQVNNRESENISGVTIPDFAMRYASRYLFIALVSA